MDCHVTPSRRSKLGLAAAVAAVILSASAGAVVGQPYPNRPIRMVQPFSPGGTSDTLARILVGQIQILFSDMPVALPHSRSGRVRAIAVTSAHRTPLVPGVPTVQEAGVPGYALVNWWGILAPKGLPADITSKWHAELVRIHTLPEVRERYANLGVDPQTNTPEQFTAHIRSEAAAFAKIIRASGARLD